MRIVSPSFIRFTVILPAVYENSVPVFYTVHSCRCYSLRSKVNVLKILKREQIVSICYINAISSRKGDGGA